MDIFYITLQGLFIGFTIPYILDNFIGKRCIIDKARYFFLHIFFNLWVTFVVFNDSINLLKNPESGLDFHYSYPGILSTSAISAFHYYHYLNFTNLTFDDYIHHVVSCLLVPLIGISLPFGRIPSLCNIGMCGIPGGIDYFLLFLVKYDIISKITEKNLNRWLNLIIRWPIMFMTSYIFIINFHKLNINISYFILMNIAMLLHLLNAIYYCEKVIGNYHINLLLKNK